MRVAVVGAGLMGAQLGAEYALGGHDVALVASSPASSEAARARAQRAIAVLREERLIDPGRADAALARLGTATLADACRGAALIVESLPEDLALKTRVLRAALDAADPGTIVATNTSSLRVTVIGEGAGAPERTVGAHYANPAILMPLVEVVPGERTREDVVRQVVAILHGLGKETIVVRDAPGFLWNRLQYALLREAARIVRDGIASPGDVDLAMKRTLARRWQLVGPFETMALGGARTFAAIARELFPEVEAHVDPESLERVALPEATAELRLRRDRALARLLREERDHQR